MSLSFAISLREPRIVDVGRPITLTLVQIKGGTALISIMDGSAVSSAEVRLGQTITLEGGVVFRVEEWRGEDTAVLSVSIKGRVVLPKSSTGTRYSVRHSNHEGKMFRVIGAVLGAKRYEMDSKIVLVWDPEIVTEDEYADIVKALGDLSRACGAVGVVRTEAQGFSATVGEGVEI